MFNSLLKKLSQFQKESKILREQNKNLQNELQRLQVLLQNALKDVEYSRESYKTLQSVNKSLSSALKNSIKIFKLDEADHSEETQKHLNLIEESLLLNSTHRNNGLFNLINYN